MNVSCYMCMRSLLTLHVIRCIHELMNCKKKKVKYRCSIFNLPFYFDWIPDNLVKRSWVHGRFPFMDVSNHSTIIQWFLAHRETDMLPDSCHDVHVPECHVVQDGCDGISWGVWAAGFVLEKYYSGRDMLWHCIACHTAAAVSVQEK